MEVMAAYVTGQVLGIIEDEDGVIVQVKTRGPGERMDEEMLALIGGQVEMVIRRCGDGHERAGE